jgi:hypothetical protein
MSAKRQRNRRALYIGPSIPDDLSAETKSALALRNAANSAGRCPSCGATFTLRSQRGGVSDFVMEHENDCPVLEVSS